MKHVTRILEERAEYQKEIAQAKKNKNRKTKQIASPPIQPKI
jgi:chorismate mutase